MAATACESTEERRQVEQARLDLLKSPLERNQCGQFATPSPLALSLARYAREVHREGPVTFLDPAVGTGSFFSALCQAFPRESIRGATGVELDPLFAQAAADLWERQGLEVVAGDFTKLPVPEEKFNLVLTNPPYVRHHHLSGTDKERLKAQVARSLRCEISGLAGLYCYFLLLCHDWMEESGLGIWLIPSEFMDVNYGISLRQYLTERVTLLHIHRFCPTDVQFTDALVSSAVVVFRNSLPAPGDSARFSFGGEIQRPQIEACIPLETLRRSRKWTQFPASSSFEESREITLGDLFAIKRGLATGCNDFFLLSRSEIERWEIPAACLKPILPGPRNLSSDIVDALPDGSPDVSPQLFLLDCVEPEERIEAKWPRFYEYLQTGRERKVHEAYIASHREPWYSQEIRLPAPFLCTYMGRSRDGKHPFRFIWNRSRATAHNVYLLLYPRGPLQGALRHRPELHRAVFDALNRIGPAHFVSEGRVYGGGLHKVEPKELAKVPAGPLLEAIGVDARMERQEELFA